MCLKSFPYNPLNFFERLYIFKNYVLWFIMYIDVHMTRIRQVKINIIFTPGSFLEFTRNENIN